MRIVTLITASLICHACVERKSAGVAMEDSVSVTPIKDAETRASAQPAMIWASDGVQVYGDTSECTPMIGVERKKFEPFIMFEDFSVKRDFDRSKAKLILDGDAKRFRTVIKNAYVEDTEHFAGHYIFVQWGCGSPCQDGVLIDRNTGQVYNIPDGAAGYEFRDNSRMLITNPPDTSGFYMEGFFYSPAIYVFNEMTKAFDKREPGKF